MNNLEVHDHFVMNDLANVHFVRVVRRDNHQVWNISTNNHNHARHKHWISYYDSFCAEHSRNSYSNYDNQQLHHVHNHRQYYLHLFGIWLIINFTYLSHFYFLSNTIDDVWQDYRNWVGIMQVQQNYLFKFNQQVYTFRHFVKKYKYDFYLVNYFAN